MINALTIDVEDYFQTECMAPYAPRYTWKSLPSRVVGNTERLLELLSELRVKATFFFLGWVAEQFPSLVRKAIAGGHEIACHSYAHHPVFRISPSHFRADTLRAKRAIEDAGGVQVDCYRAPSFSIIPSCYWAFEVLAELGFSRDSSINPVAHPTYGNPAAPRGPWVVNSAIVEYPIATWRVGHRNFPVGGGAYFRFFPYQFIASGIRAMNRAGMAATFYLHPWEMDPQELRLGESPVARLRQQFGTRTTERKLRRLLRDHSFGTLAQAYKDIPLKPSQLSSLQEAA